MGGYIERNIFISCIFTLIMFNIFYGLSLPADAQIIFLFFMALGTGVGFIGIIVSIACIAGSHIALGAFGFEFETDLDSETVKTIVGCALIFMLLFQYQLVTIPIGPNLQLPLGIGTGLVNPLFKIFTLGTDPLSNILYMFAIAFTFITIISGIMMVVI